MKVSKSAARRFAAAAAAVRATVPELPAEVAPAVEAYRPAGLGDTAWAAARPHFLEVMARAGLRTREDAKKYRVVLGPYLAWRATQGLGTEPAAAMTFAGVDEYYSRCLLDVVARSTANDYRSILRRLAQRANPGLGAPVVATVGHQPVRPGYSASEIAAIERVALRQRTPAVRRRMCAYVGLCAGAGLRPEDLRDLRARDVVDLGDDGIRVDVGGRNPRTVWVRQALEDVVRAGLEGLEPGQLVLGRDVNRRNVTTKATVGADLGDCPFPEAVRLRSTWLSWLMCEAVPVAVILDAAGLVGARTLTNLLPTLPPPTVGAKVVRGAGR